VGVWLLSAAISLAPAAALLARAQTPPAPSAADRAAASALLKQRAAELLAALQEYRASLERLLPLKEQALTRAIERQALRRDLYAGGIISRRELEAGELAVATAKQAVDDTRRAIEDTDRAAAEAAATEALAELPPPGPGAHQQTALVTVYRGPAPWSLDAGAARLREMFAARFGRALPISAMGQTPLHDRLGFDHHGALDIAVHPDSPEGVALIEYLRSQGIPYIAFRGAVAGSASGAHIHVGLPSPRISVQR